MSALFQSVSFFLLSFTPCFFLFFYQGRTVSCVLVAFSDWQNLIPLPLMCVSHATVTLVEQSMGARHVPRYTPGTIEILYVYTRWPLYLVHLSSIGMDSVFFVSRTAKMICGINSTRCWKESSEILIHIHSIMHPVRPHPKRALLG